MALSEIQLMDQAEAVHRIGPNAVTRVAEVLGEQMDAAEVARLFDLAHIGRYLREPPQRMVDEREVTALHRVLRAQLGLPRAQAVAAEAGRRTGDYLLAHRIPRGVQRLLKMLPALLASRVLMRAIQRHAWTFAGSGELRVQPAFPPRLAIAGCCVCRGETAAQTPLCDFYAAAIGRLFQVLVHPRSVARETACEAMGAAACTFEVQW